MENTKRQTIPETKMQIHEGRDRKCNIYATHNWQQQEPSRDNYAENSSAEVWHYDKGVLTCT